MKRLRFAVRIMFCLAVIFTFPWSALSLQNELSEQNVYATAKRCTSSKQTACLELRRVAITKKVERAAFKDACKVNMTTRDHHRYVASVPSEKCSLPRSGSLVFLKDDTTPRQLLVADASYNLYDGDVKIAIKAVLFWISLIATIFVVMRIGMSSKQAWPYMLHPHRLIAGVSAISLSAVAFVRSPQMISVFVACIVTTCLVEYVAYHIIRKR